MSNDNSPNIKNTYCHINDAFVIDEPQVEVEIEVCIRPGKDVQLQFLSGTEFEAILKQVFERTIKRFSA